MKKITYSVFYLLLMIALFGQLAKPVCAVAYPEPPSDELKEKWRQMGEENERLYGSGVVSNPTSVPVRPTVVPTLIPTSTPTTQPTPTPEITEEVSEATESALVDLSNWKPQVKWYHRVWSWFRRSFLNR